MPVPEFVKENATVAVTVLVTVGVVSVAEVARTTFPVPVDPSHEATVPSEKRNVFAPPIVPSPVPPEATARGVEIVNVPVIELLPFDVNPPDPFTLNSSTSVVDEVPA